MKFTDLTPKGLVELKDMCVKAFSESAGVKSNLSLIGVDKKYHDIPPSVVSFPSKFNPDARNLWTKLLTENDLHPFTVAKQWEMIIDMYLDACEEQGIAPFKDTPDPSDNRRIIAVLTEARKKVVRFFDNSKIFNVVTVTYKGVDFITSANTLSVKSYAEITGYGSIHNLVNYLKALEFKDMPMGMRLAVSAVCTITVEKITDGSALVTYTITVSTPVYHPSMRIAIVPDDEMQKWVDRNIWKPIVRAHRFKTAKSTLF